MVIIEMIFTDLTLLHTHGVKLTLNLMEMGFGPRVAIELQPLSIKI